MKKPSSSFLDKLSKHGGGQTSAAASPAIKPDPSQQSVPDTERSAGALMSELPATKTIGLETQGNDLGPQVLPSELDGDPAAKEQIVGAARQGAAQGARSRQKAQKGGLSVRISSLAASRNRRDASKQGGRAEGRQSSSLGTQVDAVSPWNGKTPEAMGFADMSAANRLSSQAGIIDILVSDQQLQAAEEAVRSRDSGLQPQAEMLIDGRASVELPSTRPMPSTFSPQHKDIDGARNGSRLGGTALASTQMRNPKSSKNAKAGSSLFRTLATSHNRAAIEQSKLDQNFLETDSFLQISQKQVSINKDVLEARKNQLKSTGFRQKDLLSCLTSESERQRSAVE